MTLAPGSNSIPDALVAICTHRLAMAMRDMRVAKAGARLAGLTPSDLTAAIKLLSANPDLLAKKQERLGAVLVALKAGAVCVEADLFERTTDERPAQRAERIWNDGYVAAVLGDACEPGALVGEDAERWRAGWAAFRAVLEDHEARRATA